MSRKGFHAAPSLLPILANGGRLQNRAALLLRLGVCRAAVRSFDCVYVSADVTAFRASALQRARWRQSEVATGKIRFRHSYRSSAPRFARLGESSRGAGEELNVAVALDQKSAEAAPQINGQKAPCEMTPFFSYAGRNVRFLELWWNLSQAGGHSVKA